MEYNVVTQGYFIKLGMFSVYRKQCHWNPHFQQSGAGLPNLGSTDPRKNLTGMGEKNDILSERGVALSEECGDLP